MSNTKFGIEMGLRFEKGKNSKGNVIYKGLRLLDEGSYLKINYN